MTERTQARACASCGALNDAAFGSCIRCARRLSEPPRRGEPARALLDPATLPATKLIGAATLLVFAGQMMIALQRHKGIALFGSNDTVGDIRCGALFPDASLVLAEPWRLLSAVFVHFGVLHVLLNLSALVNLARIAEPAVGSARFVVAYVVTGIAGFATTVAYDTILGGEGARTAGASGAIFGILGLVLGWLLRRKDPRWKDLAIQAVGYLVVFALVNAASSSVRINNSAHLGGLLTGALFGVVYGGSEAGRTPMWANIVAVLALLACAASLVLAQLSPLWRQPLLGWG